MTNLHILMNNTTEHLSFPITVWLRLRKQLVSWNGIQAQCKLPIGRKWMKKIEILGNIAVFTITLYYFQKYLKIQIKIHWWLKAFLKLVTIKMLSTFRSQSRTFFRGSEKKILCKSADINKTLFKTQDTCRDTWREPSVNTPWGVLHLTQ